MGLLSSFIEGAAMQANANIVENKKRIYERDKRREEAADALDLYMKQNTFKSKLDEDAKIAEETRGLDLYKKKSDVDFGTYTKQKGVDLSTAKQLESYKTDQDLRKIREEASEARRIVDSFNLGDIAPSTPSGTNDELYRKKSAYESLQGNKVMAPYAKGMADSINTQIQRNEKRSEVFNKPITSAGGGDPFKELDDSLQKDTFFTEKILNPKYYSEEEAESKKDLSIGNVKQLMSAMMKETRDINPETGGPTSYSKLNSTDVKNSAITIESALAILDSPKSSEEEKHKAVLQIDGVLSDRGIKRNDLIADPDLRTVFNEERKAKFNTYLKPVQAAPTNAGQLPGATTSAPTTAQGGIPEGTIAKNAKGQRIKYTNGKWVNL
jgi:hypothetical protein